MSEIRRLIGILRSDRTPRNLQFNCKKGRRWQSGAGREQTKPRLVRALSPQQATRAVNVKLDSPELVVRVRADAFPEEK